MKVSSLNIMNSAIILSIAGLCFSGSFSAIQFFPTVQAQTEAAISQPSIEEMNVKMAQIISSDKPEDIATLAYIWGFPLVTMERQFNYVTNPNIPPGIGRGPPNSISCAQNLADVSYTDAVSPNSDTLYCQTQFDLTSEPVVVTVPPIKDRYWSFLFIDAYTNDYAYLGQRASGGDGGTYLVVGPNWTGQVPEGMTKIWTPTNLAWLLTRTLVKGPADLDDAKAINDKIIVSPLSAYQANTTSSPAPVTETNSKEIPIGPQPSLIAPTGIKIFDEIGAAMIGNPLNPPDPALVTKLASIGIGPGKTPSREANDTIKTALQFGVTEGQKLIDAKVARAGILVNGWLVNAQTGVYGTDYLFRAAITQVGLGANIAQEALYPTTFTDSEGKPYSGNNSYLIHFEPGQTPPVDSFWSITMYNSTSNLVDNPINRYSIGKYTEGLKNNTDGSLDIYVQHKSPGADKESNWLPSPDGGFNMILRTYLPQSQILNGTWQPPAVQMVG